ncbi:unnamed protein product [Ixodes pacificus]
MRAACTNSRSVRATSRRSYEFGCLRVKKYPLKCNCLIMRP